MCEVCVSNPVLEPRAARHGIVFLCLGTRLRSRGERLADCGHRASRQNLDDSLVRRALELRKSCDRLERELFTTSRALVSQNLDASAG